MIEDVNSNLHELPSNPGVYQFFDKNENIIYIGKAKNLKKRINSYFNRTSSKNNKLKTLVNKIHDIKYFIVDNESDALLLENNLIKKYQPKYNILLKDDKTYPWIVVKNEWFPRIFYTRNIIEDGSDYFGPYTSLLMVKTLLDLIRKLYKLRSCKYSLSLENITKNKFNPCLEFHLNNCNAPCIGNQNEYDYLNSINQIKNILKGNISEVQEHLKTLMNEYSINYKFEEAQKIKDKLEILEKYQEKSCIVNRTISNVDVFTILLESSLAYINFIKVMAGSIIQSYNIEILNRLNENKTDLLIYAIIDIRQRFKSTANEILVPFQLNYKINNTKITVPKTGDKKHLLELSERNLRFFQLEKLKKSENYHNKSKTDNILYSLKNDLHLKEIPIHIECFDNSNMQGKNAVASCVVFKHGKPSKNDYRHFNIKTVYGPNDYASMAEIVYRRYSRLAQEKDNYPQLIIIDGGRGQLMSAYKSLKRLNLENIISIIAIAKKLELIYCLQDAIPIYLNKTSYTLKLLQQIRNEAHRFAISFHALKRDKELSINELESIAGIGPSTLRILYKKYKNLKQIENIHYNELKLLLGNSKASRIFNYLHKNKK